jgi:WD40 repeat protein
MLVTGSTDASLHMVTVGRMNAAEVVKGPHTGVKTMCYSTQHSLLVSGGLDQAICVWNITTCKLLSMMTFQGG